MFKIFLYKEDIKQIEAYVKAVSASYDYVKWLPTIEQFVMAIINKLKFVDPLQWRTEAPKKQTDCYGKICIKIYEPGN